MRTRTVSGARLWALVQVFGVLATGVLLAGLVLRPETSLSLLWNVIIPLVPVALLAIGGGIAFDAKGGFCNTVCPVLPVERHYGQRPLVDLDNPRCATCTACAPACIDLAPRTAALHAIGRGDGGIWTRTAFGAFAAAFPGFVLGYFTTADGPASSAPWIYAQIAAWCGISWIATSLIVARRIPAQTALPVLAALAAGVYYAFAAPRLAAAVGWADAGGAFRIAFLTLVVTWWGLGQCRHRGTGTARPAQGLRAA